MSENQQHALEEAYLLIEAQKLGEARNVLEKLLATEQSSADVWWLYAHAVEDPQQAIPALEKVVALDPNHAEAKNLLKTAKQQTYGAGDDDDFDIDFDDDDDFAIADAEPTQPEDSRRRSLIIFGSILGLVLIGLVILIASPRGEQATTETETLVAQGASTNTPANVVPLVTDEIIGTPMMNTPETVIGTTDVPVVFSTATPDVQLSPEQPILTPDDVLLPSVENFLNALSENYPTNGQTETLTTALNSTLLVSMCTTRGEGHQGLVPEAMRGLSNAVQLLPSSFDAVGVRFLDCNNNETINVMAIAVESALAFFNTDLSEQDFRRSWRVIDA